MRLIVVGLDGSDASRAAFAAALEHARTPGAAIKAVHTFSYPVTTIYQAVHVSVEDLRRAAESWMAGELEVLLDDNEAAVVESVVRPGHTGAVLVEEAADADLLVVGSRGLGGVKSLMAGSVSTFCLHHLPCALLVVPPPAESADS